MEAFSQLLQQLYFTSSSNEKSRLLRHYLAHTADPDRGWAIAALAGTLKFEFFKRNAVKNLMLERVDPDLCLVCSGGCKLEQCRPQCAGVFTEGS